MIEEKAIVTNLINLSGKPQQAELQVVRDKPCGLCGKTQGCGISLLSQFAGHQSSAFSVSNIINAKVGDIVIVGVEDKALLTSALFLYGFPLFGLMLGAMIGSQFAQNAQNIDLFSAFGAVAGLMIMILFVKFNFYAKRLGKNAQITLLRKADESQC